MQIAQCQASHVKVCVQRLHLEVGGQGNGDQKFIVFQVEVAVGKAVGDSGAGSTEVGRQLGVGVLVLEPHGRFAGVAALDEGDRSGVKIEGEMLQPIKRNVSDRVRFVEGHVVVERRFLRRPGADEQFGRVLRGHAAGRAVLEQVHDQNHDDDAQPDPAQGPVGGRSGTAARLVRRQRGVLAVGIHGRGKLGLGFEDLAGHFLRTAQLGDGLCFFFRTGSVKIFVVVIQRVAPLLARERGQKDFELLHELFACHGLFLP